ncbi:hypothetical protein [Enteroscipio rubneri]|uniref:Uncharacterized protein n=1 Tax=Enteroscipio rubneri TaxID=2070686 RepID=A0A2K2UAA6_9ACTN|nr:hypothetical protein [Enteroscipio rubneri]PNV67172.1 hypothetical protein C2L71_09565 [Enteroscipio rubneri]
MDNPSAIIDAAVAVFGYLDLAIRLFGLLALVAIVLGAFAGVTQALWRFGLALFGKKILVVAGENDYRDICEDLTDSGLIKNKNIQRVSSKHVDKAHDALLLIVVYGYLEPDDFESVVRAKNSRCGLIVHCPPEKGRITEQEMNLLSRTPFTALCNFRGRMVNDVLLMMLSTSFKRKDLG